MLDVQLDLVPLEESHSTGLKFIIDSDKNNPNEWVSSRTSAESVERIQENHLTNGFFWAIYVDGALSGFVGFMQRGDEPESGFSTNTYISAVNRGKGINQFVKEALIELLARTGVTLYSKINKTNSRSLKAMYKIMGYDTEVKDMGDFVVFEATKKAKERALFDLDNAFDDDLDALILKMGADCIPFLEAWKVANNAEPELRVLEETLILNAETELDEDVLESLPTT